MKIADKIANVVLILTA